MEHYFSKDIEKGNDLYNRAIKLGKKFPQGTEVVYTGTRESEVTKKEGIVEYPLDDEMRLSFLFDGKIVVWDLNKEEHIQDLEKFLNKSEKKKGGKKTRRRTKRGGKKIRRKTNKRKTNKRRSRK